MAADHYAAPLLPRWVGVVWIWLPALAGLMVLGGVAAMQGEGGSGVWWAGAAVGCGVAYAVRDRWPICALALSLVVVAAARLPGAGVLRSEFDVVYLLLLFVPVLPLVAVASTIAPKRSAVGLVVTILVGVGVSPDPVWSTTTYSAQAAVVTYVLAVGVPVMIVLGAWLAGFALLFRQRHADALLGRAVSVERTRDAEAARAVAEERARIAQELHDVITHTVAVMVVQASAAEAVWDRSPDEARAALRAVEESGRTVMADLRGMLGPMRHDAAPDTSVQAGTDALPALVGAVRSAGLTSTLTLSGPADMITPAVGVSLLRIAQESVTNALRHADASTVTLDLEVDETMVRLSVCDDGLGYDAVRAQTDVLDPLGLGGHGVAGMRERARVIGGTLEIRPADGGGTCVTVRAPLRLGVRA